MPDRPAELIEYIQCAYHRLIVDGLRASGDMLSRSLAEYGDDCHDLYSLGRLMERLRLLVAGHIALEEDLFLAAVHPASVSSAVRGIEDLLRRDGPRLAALHHDLRLLTLDYTGFGRRCPGTAPLMASLRELEVDCKRHLYVEQEVLIPLLEGDGS